MALTAPLMLDGATLDYFKLVGPVRQLGGSLTVGVQLGLDVPVRSLLRALDEIRVMAQAAEPQDAAEVDDYAPSVAVKNTFLSVEERGAQLPRTTTAPPICSGQNEDEQDMDTYHTDDSQAPYGLHGRGAPAVATPFGRTVTHDNYSYEGADPSTWVNEVQDPGLMMAAVGGFPLMPPIDPWQFPMGFLPPPITPGLAFQQTFSGLPIAEELPQAEQFSTRSKTQKVPQTLRESFDIHSGNLLVSWALPVVSAAIGDEQPLSSPEFWVNTNAGSASSSTARFTVRIRPPMTTDSSKRCSIELVCGSQAGAPKLAVGARLHVGSRSLQELERPILHDFAASRSVELGVWDLTESEAVDEGLTLTLEVFSGDEARFRAVEAVAHSDRSGSSEGRVVVVKNTFVDFEDSSRSISLRRTATAPPAGAEKLSFGSTAYMEPMLEHDEEDATDPAEPSSASSAQPCVAVLPATPPGFLSAQPPVVKTQVLHRSFDATNARFTLEWVVSSKKLTSTDTHPHVSPAFELSFGSISTASFKMMIYPLVVNDKKGGGSFKKAQGRGYVELACEDELPPCVPDVRFWVSIGTGERCSPVRGPVDHNFADKAVCGLPRKQALWDFTTAVDKATQSFVVRLEVSSSNVASTGGRTTAVEPGGIPQVGSKRW